MKKNKTSKAWMHRHVSDHWVQRARAEGYRSRAAYKLLEIDDKDKLFRRGLVVVDLGSAPGGWSQVAARRVAPGGRVVALDLLEMEPIPGVEFLRGDFREEAVLDALENLLGGQQVGLVISDMAPNLSGITVVDQSRVEHLAELALQFAEEHLAPGGDLLIKLFHGAGFEATRAAMRKLFAQVVVRKPQASRDRSREVYLLGRGKR